MSGETETNVSGWTTDTLHALLRSLREADARWLEERDRRMEAEFDARDNALTLQLTETQRRLTDLNHENARVKSQQETSVSRESFEGQNRLVDAELVRLAERIHVLELEQRANVAVKTGSRELWGYLTGFIGIGVAVAALIIRI